MEPGTIVTCSGCGQKTKVNRLHIELDKKMQRKSFEAGLEPASPRALFVGHSFMDS